jgi:hypothetical protein
MVRFPYLTTLGLGSGKLTSRPFLDVEIHYKDTKPFRTTAIVDSGSDITLMDAELAEYFGIDELTCEQVALSGVTGKSSGFVGYVAIKIEGFEEMIPQTVIFTRELKTGILLGQQCFFAYFRITFDKANNIFELERNNVSFEV